MKRTFFLLIIVLICFNIKAQEHCFIKGRITNSEGEAIPYSSIYVPSIAKGSMANIDGEYAFKVPCGEHEIVFQSLGYARKTIVQIINGQSEIDIQLATISYQLREVTVDPSSEDPAYNYIRKATAMARYYRRQIRAYNCNLYVRSFYDVDNIPWVAKKLAPEDELAEMQTGDITETILEYSYEYPNKVKEKIIATKSGSKDTTKFGSEYINLSFYQLGGPWIINPLSKNAFHVYNFEHIHTYFDGAQAVHKIRILPKRKGNDLMKGHIYINDKLWNINKVDVEFDQTLAKIKYKQIYNAVQGNVWMPIHHQMKVRVSAIGFKLDVNYLAALSELSVKTDSTVDTQIKSMLQLAPPPQEEEQQVSIAQTTVNLPKKANTQEKIENILQKDKLSKTESLKLVRLIKKQERELEKQVDTVQSMELSSNRDVKYVDSAFTANDSIWANRRDIPLSETEHNIYAARDSLNKVQSGDTVINEPQNALDRILYFSGTVKSKNKNIRFQPKGLTIGLNGAFNTVDGFVIEKNLFTYEWNNRKDKFYTITPWIGYTTARKTYLGGMSGNLQYNKNKRGGFFYSIGRNSADFNSFQPISPFINSISSLFFEENYRKIYQKDYWQVGHHIDIRNGIQLGTSFTYEDRKQLFNNTSQKWINSKNREYTANIPLNNEAILSPEIIENHQAFIFEANLTYTPKQYFQYIREKKVMRHSKYPTFIATYKQGIDNVGSSDANFQFISFAIKQRRHLQLIDRISYHIEAGTFLNTPSLFFADYKNFNAQPFYLLSNNDASSFKLLNSYTFNSNDYYLEGHFALTDNHLLLKNLPLLNTTGLSESLSLNYLITEQKTHYTEIGYSLNNILLLMDVGAYVNFKDDQYNDWGIRLRFKGFND